MEDMRLCGRENENHLLWCDTLSLGRNLPTLKEHTASIFRVCILKMEAVHTR